MGKMPTGVSRIQPNVWSALLAMTVGIGASGCAADQENPDANSTQAVETVGTTEDAFSFGCNRLTENNSLGIGEILTSCDGTGKFGLQWRDGAGATIAQTNGGCLCSVYGIPLGAGSDARIYMQADGNLVVYSNGRAVWSSNTAGNSGAFAVVGDGGRLQVRDRYGRLLQKIEDMAEMQRRVIRY